MTERSYLSYFPYVTKLFLLLSLFSILLSGCNAWYFSSGSHLLPNNESSVLSEDASLNFSVVQKNAMSTCLRCHSGQVPPTLLNYNDVHQNLTKVMSEIEDGQMPPRKAGFEPLSDCEKDLLRAWVREGAPETTAIKVGHLASCDHFMPPPPVDTTPISQLPLTYESVEKRIFTPKCIVCHNTDNTDSDASNTLLSPFTTLMSSNLVKDTAANSKLYRICAKGSMPPKKSKIQPLTADELSLLQRWLDAGHPEK